MSTMRNYVRSILLFICFLILLAFFDLRDIIVYFSSPDCKKCRLEYTVVVSIIGPKVVYETHSFSIEFESMNSSLVLQCDNDTISVDVFKLNVSCAEISGVRLRSSPSFRACITNEDGVPMIYVSSSRGYVLYHADIVYRRCVYEIELSNTSCSWKCFELNSLYYISSLLLRLALSFIILFLIKLASRLWGRSR